jgi:exodeoxyribonuclease (lambda-induced)
MEQRTTEWFEARKGKFTASQIESLLGKITLKRTTDKINNYAMKKAGEMYFGLSEEEVFFSKDVQRGIDLEPTAFAKFQALKRLEFIEVTESPFMPYNEHSGASPDGYLKTTNEILEIKCPTIETFNKLVLTGEINPKYFAQMQMQMLSTGTEVCHFFNYVVHNEVEYHHTILIERCEDTIAELKERIDYATEIKIEYLKTLQKKLD